MDGMRGKPLPGFMVDQIRRLRRQGVSIRAIAAIAGVATATVQKYIRPLTNTTAVCPLTRNPKPQQEIDPEIADLLDGLDDGGGDLPL